MSESPASAQPDRESPRRVSGFTAGCVLISNVVGTGIFTTTGFMARDLGEARLILALWVVGTLLALAGALSYSELGAAMPLVGGEYVYLREAYNPLVGFLSGWASFTVGFAAAIAAGAVSFAAYLLEIAPVFSGSPAGLSEEKLLALALVWTLTAVHVAGVGLGGLVQQVLTVLKIGAILGLVGAALTVGTGSWGHLAEAGPAAAPGFGTVVVSFIFVTYAYSGWNAAGYIAGEVVAPERTVPRAMIGGTLVVGLLYLGLNLVYVYALPVSALARPPVLPVAEKAAVALFGAVAAHLVAGLLCLAIAGAVSAMIWAGPRVYYAMAKDGLFPAFFAHTGTRTLVPGQAILMQSLWATVLILSGTFEQLVVYSGVVLATFTGMAVGAVLVLRWRRPGLPRPFRVPWYPFPPALYLAASGVIVTWAALERPVETLWAAATVGAGVPLYLWWNWDKK